MSWNKTIHLVLKTKKQLHSQKQICTGKIQTFIFFYMTRLMFFSVKNNCSNILSMQSCDSIYPLTWFSLQCCCSWFYDFSKLFNLSFHMVWWEKMSQAILLAKNTEDLRKWFNEKVAARNPKKRVTKRECWRIKGKRGENGETKGQGLICWLRSIKLSLNEVNNCLTQRLWKGSVVFPGSYMRQFPP